MKHQESHTFANPDIVAYCAKCKKEWAKLEDARSVGTRFWCPKEDPPELPQIHHASVVKGNRGIFWLKIENKILRYEAFYGLLPIFNREFSKISAGLFVTIKLILSLCLLYISTIISELKYSLIIIPSALLIIDTIIIHISIIFISRFPANALRSVTYMFSCFFNNRDLFCEYICNLAWWHSRPEFW